MARPDEVIERWSDEIAAALPTIPNCCVRTVLVYASVSSTQDAAWRHRVHGVGTAVVASEQTAGRGRLGRKWDDGHADTLPISVVLPTAMGDAALSARAGLAALDGCRRAAPDADIRIKWPNDIVAGDEGERGKLAGVLVERRDGHAVVGIGINVFRVGRVAGADAGYHARSLEELGGMTDRCGLAIRVIDALSRWLVADDHAVRARWAAHDAMVGTRRAFVVDHERVVGTVTRLDPLGVIEVDGRAVPVDRARTDSVDSD